METLIRKELTDHIIRHNILTDSQYGFVKGRSTTLNLLSYLDKCAELVADGDVVDCIYFDFSKAFDTVAHSLLLGKLDSYGVRGALLKWLESFLVGRTQVVSVNGKRSFVGNVKSGVPQGSVLGPVLFLLFINDMPDCVRSFCQLFADDTKVFNKVANLEDALLLQNDVSALVQWSFTWLLNFHPDKCKVLTLGPIERIWKAYNYTMMNSNQDEISLEHVGEEKDLGIIFQENLSFDEHIHSRIKKANQMMGLIRRVFTFLEILIHRICTIAA